MITPKTTRIHHPSGHLFEAFCRFTASHPDASWFQSDRFFRFALQWPEAEPVLLLAVRESGLKDPGKDRPQCAGRLGTKDGFLFDVKQADQPEVSQSEDPAKKFPIAGSLLGVVIREPRAAGGVLAAARRVLNPLTARTIVYGGPLLGEGTRLEKEMTLQVLVRALQDKVKPKSLFTQYRNFFDMSDYVPVFRNLGFSWQDRLNLRVNTHTRDRAWDGMHGSKKRQVQKSLNSGAVLIHDPDKGQVDDFYNLLKKLYVHKVKKPLPSRAFFQLLGQGHGKIILLGYGGRIIGGMACPILAGKAMYEWYVCGLDREYASQGIYPSVLLTWAAMEYAASKQIPVFDFMGLGKPDTPYGVRDFKKKFGGQLFNPGRFTMINKKLLYHIASVGYRLFFYRALRL